MNFLTSVRSAANSSMSLIFVERLKFYLFDEIEYTNSTQNSVHMVEPEPSLMYISLECRVLKLNLRSEIKQILWQLILI